MKKTFRFLKDEHREKIEDVTRKEVTNLITCAWNCGYYIRHPFYANGKLMLEVFPNGKIKFSPEIKIINKDSYLGIEKFCVQVKPTETNDLSLEEYKSYINAQKKARILAEEIQLIKDLESEVGETFPIVITEDKE